MDFHLQFSLIRLAKFCALMAYSFGVGVGLGPFGLAARKRVVHLVASPALIVVWLAGYAMTLYTGVALTELWVMMGFSCSLVAHLILNGGTRRLAVSRGQGLGVLLFLGSTLAFMVFRPTWSRLAL